MKCLGIFFLVAVFGVGVLSLKGESVEDHVKAAIQRTAAPGFTVDRVQLSNIRLVRLLGDVTYGDPQHGLDGDSLKSANVRYANCTDQPQQKDLTASVTVTVSSETQMTHSVETTQELSVDIGGPIQKLLNFGVKESLRQTVKISTQETQKVSRDEATSVTEHFTIPAKTVFFLVASRIEKSYSLPFSGRAVLDADLFLQAHRGNTTSRTVGTVPLSTSLGESDRTFDFAGLIKGVGVTDVNEETNSRSANTNDPNDCVPVP